MEDATIYWAVLCLAIALVLFFMEVFVPSGGLIGLIASVALVAGIVLMFQVNTTLGMFSAIVALIAAPFVLALAMKLWPNTPLGRLLTLQSPASRARTDNDPLPDSDKLQELVGATGKAISDLRPVGTCLINGERHECLAEGGTIDAGAPVKVVSVDGMQIKVRQAG